MMQFTVPQFLDVEDKILGPITVRQFIILLVDGIVLAVVWKLADLALFAVFALFLGGGGLILAFVKINGQPFHYFLLNFLQTLKRPTLRVWQKKFSDKELMALSSVEKLPPPPPKPFKEAISVSRLSEMSLVVDTGGRYSPEE
ncbi:MAG TPA: PrgI family protein [Candidatus Magasanikbacteria bacterium]|nr:PrgI family protein [Candidatus Magasanikbacteria bacterium]